MTLEWTIANRRKRSEHRRRGNGGTNGIVDRRMFFCEQVVAVVLRGRSNESRRCSLCVVDNISMRETHDMVDVVRNFLELLT